MIIESGAELLDMKPIKKFADKKRLTDDDLRYLKLKAVDENEWILVKYKVNSDCSIKEFIERQESIFKRGCAFYEFKNEVECISEDQQLILYENVCNNACSLLHKL